jgi:enoyl-[acyl-carrier protein] reductase I
MLSIDMTGKRAFVAGVADDGGFGWAIAKSLAEAGAGVSVGTWPPAHNIFTTLLRRGKLDASRPLANGTMLAFEGIFPLDAAYDALNDAPESVRTDRRYAEKGDFSIEGVAKALLEKHGPESFDVLVHSLANSSEVKKPLLETSRGGYLGAVGTSAYSLISMLRAFMPLMRRGGSVVSLTYEVGRSHGLRVNTISAGPWASRAASAIGFIDEMVRYAEANTPVPEALDAREVGNAAAFLASPLASGITGVTLYVDKGFHAMGKAVAWPDAPKAEG